MTGKETWQDKDEEYRTLDKEVKKESQERQEKMA